MKAVVVLFALCLTAVLARDSPRQFIVKSEAAKYAQHTAKFVRDDQVDVLSDEIIKEVNSANAGWTAGRNQYFESFSVAQAKDLMGSLLGKKSKVSIEHPLTTAAPSAFDARKQWPGCVGPIMNQAKCGSCWAFGAAEAISDRMCITGLKNNGTAHFVQLAPLDLVTCNQDDNGCEGGMPLSAWEYAQEQGLVHETCYPYGTWETPNAGPIPTCTPQQQPCLNFVQTPQCTPKCVTGESWSSSKVKINRAYSVNSVEQMEQELMTNGPVEAAFTVFADFPHYKSGVYKHTTGSALGGHAIKIIGWGVENGEDYWLVQNSWTTTWGDGGYFKILKGADECGIEDDVVAGTF